MSSRGSESRKRTPRGLVARDTIVIATEGEKTEPDYFKALQRKFRGINVDVVQRNPGESDPRQVLRDLVNHKKTRSRRFSNVIAYWMVIDNDGRADEIFDDVAKDAVANECHIADSNPCFELWLLFHKKSLDDYNCSELKELKSNKKPRARSSRRRLELELVKEFGSYNKKKLKTSDYIPNIGKAIENARKSDVCSCEAWMDRIGSRVYKLAESIIKSDKSPHNPRH